MAPKKQTTKAAKGQEKSKQAAKQKVAEDKTFGLKNKNKSAKVQKYVEQVKNQAQTNKNQKKQERVYSEEEIKAKIKKEKAAQKEAVNQMLLANIIQPKVPAGVDPKSILCEYHKHGLCQKGFKCKFSHDLDVGRKQAKIDLYTDQRDINKEDDDMEDWDQDKLEAVVKQKHGAEGGQPKKTDIICKYFLDAVEEKKYGWFWKCPNGVKCHYRHALPQGYVLKSQMKALMKQEADNRKDVSETIEEERANVVGKTIITEDVFKKWREEKQAERQAELDKKAAERKKKGLLTGREIFLQDNFTAVDDESAAVDYTRETDEEAAIKQMKIESERRQKEAQMAASEERETAGAESSQERESGNTANGGGQQMSNGAGTSNGVVRGSQQEAGPSTIHEEAEDSDEQIDEDEDLDDDDFDDDDLGDEELDALQSKLMASNVS